MRKLTCSIVNIMYMYFVSQSTIYSVYVIDYYNTATAGDCQDCT